MPAKYHVAVSGERRGPFSREELESQGMRRETLVWRKGLPDWVSAGQVPELLDIFEEPPPLPGDARAAAPPENQPALPERGPPREERPPAMELDGAASERIKDPAVNVPRAEMLPRVETPARSYRDEDDDELPPPIARARVPYDVVGMRRLYLSGLFVFVPGVVLFFAVALSIAFHGLHGYDSQTPRFGPQRKDIVHEFNPGVRSLETLGAVATVGAAVLGVICLAIGAACYFVLLYRAWMVIHDGRVSPTPGRAVGFLFIPFFNAYWVFVGVWGLGRALNRFVRRYDLEAPSASQPLGFATSVYSAMTYIPIPFAGLVPLVLNLLLLPLFARSVYRTVAAICDEANRQRIAHAPLERTLRQPLLTRPVSAHILSIVAIVLAPIGVGLFVGGFCTGLDSLRHFNRDGRFQEANRQAIAHLRGLGALDGQDQNRLRNFENQANNFDRHLNFRWRDDLIISSAVFGGGVLMLALAITLALVAGVCARHPEEARPDAASG